MIEVSVWFLIFQIIWLLAAAVGPWGPAAVAMVGFRVRLTRLVIAQLAKRLAINVSLFGGLMGGMDLAVQASQSRRDHVDWEQVMTSAGTGAVMGGFLTAFTGLVPARSIWGLMGRSGLASGATDLSMQIGSGEPFDWERLLKSFTSGVAGGADAHWASWSPLAHARTGETPTTLAHTDPSAPPAHDLPPGNAEPPGPFQILENRGEPGGETVPGFGGRYGAAGVLIRSLDDEGVPRYLLVKQLSDAPYSHQWRLPGQALDSLESPVHGVAHGLNKELSAGQGYLDRLRLAGEHPVPIRDTQVAYTNLAAEGPMFAPKLSGSNVIDFEWFTLKEVTAMANTGMVHPDLAKALPDVLGLYHQDGSGPKEGFGRPPYSGLVGTETNPALAQTIRRTDSGLFYGAPAPHTAMNAPFGSHLVSPEFGDAVWTGVFNGMSPAEKAAVHNYSGNQFRDINGYLREGDAGLNVWTPDEIPELRAVTIARIEALRAILGRLPVPETIDVFRSLSLTADLFSVPIEEVPGTVQHDAGFLSTNLGERSVFHGNVKLHLRVPEGTPAFYLKLVTGLGEQELLLGPGLSWFAEDARLQDGLWHIYGWVLPPEPGD